MIRLIVQVDDSTAGAFTVSQELTAALYHTEHWRGIENAIQQHQPPIVAGSMAVVDLQAMKIVEVLSDD